MPVSVLIALLAYLLGSVPIGLILTRRFGSVDPRQTGSHNIGATNIYRTAGRRLGILTLIGDIAKGAIPVWVAIQMGLSHWWVAFSGLTAVLGHIFPIFLGFKGGKGVATAFGTYLVISPLAVLVECFVFAGMVWKWRYVALASMTCAVTIPILIAFFRSDSKAYFVLSLVIAAFILYRHQANLLRLLSGTENKWTG